MNITLRKANAIQTAITDTIKSIKVDLVAEFNEFQSPSIEMQKLNEEFFENDTRRSNLLMAQFSIRGLVGAANATSGVDAKLTQAAYIDKRVGQLEAIASATEMTDMSIITGKLDKIRNRKEESRASLYGRDDSVSTGILTKEQITTAKAMIRDLKNQKQKLNDEILELNVRTDIALSSEVEQILRTEGIV
jgi:uncharacterized protein YdcH (DUF465 family)